MVIPWGKLLCWWPSDLSIKTHDRRRPSVVASWIGILVPDEALPPSDRGERSETFSLGGEGYPRGIAKGDAPLASFLPYLSRSKDRVGGFGGRSAPVGRGRQRRPTSLSRRDHRFPPARASGQNRQAAHRAARERRRSRPQARLAETTIPTRPRQRAKTAGGPQGRSGGAAPRPPGG